MVEAVISFDNAVFIPIKLGDKTPKDAGWSSPSYYGCGRSSIHTRVALRCDNLVVVDCDSPEAAAAWRNMTGTQGFTYTVRTPRGFHFYYEWVQGAPTGPAVGVYPHIDIRAGRGSYVLCPPTEGYEPLQTPGRPLEAFIPSWLPERHTGALTGNDGPSWDEIPEGRRNVTLAAFAGTFRRQGMSQSAILRATLLLNRLLCEEPLSRDECALIAQSVSRHSARPAITEVEVED